MCHRRKGNFLPAYSLPRSRKRIVDLVRSPQTTLYGITDRKNYIRDHENRAFDLFTSSISSLYKNSKKAVVR